MTIREQKAKSKGFRCYTDSCKARLPAPEGHMMHARSLPITLAVALAAAGVHARATLSRQQADVFARKLAAIVEQGETPSRAVRRTHISEGEVNSWFAFHGAALLPAGLSQPALTIAGSGRLVGVVTVDLDALGRRRSSGGLLDPWSLLGGRLPLTVSGLLHTRDGRGRFEWQAADISGIPVPRTLVQELLTYYSRSPERPGGVRLDDAFELPANIRQIDTAPGYAVILQ